MPGGSWALIWRFAEVSRFIRGAFLLVVVVLLGKIVFDIVKAY
jgi:hypothetical protein